jgi:DNA-binding NtrC family response regulator
VKITAPVEFDSMIGASPEFRTALAQAARSARGHEHVLVEGESGTGKDTLLRAMHAASRRAKMPLRSLNARSVKPGELEPLLFGHERGAFPGAFAGKRGELELCHGGTLVLDEANRLPADVQVRLADAMEKGRVRPLGAQYSFPVDVRIFAAINYSLADHIGESWLEPRFLAALSPTCINLPPLRARTGDIPTLARFFLARISEQTGLNDLSITDDALALLAAYQWPGNVRQLQAVLFRAAALSRSGVLCAADFPHLVRSDEETSSPKRVQLGQVGVQLYADDGHVRRLEQIEADVIRLAIGHYRGRMTEVARKLGIGRSTLYRKLHELGIDSDPEPEPRDPPTPDMAARQVSQHGPVAA